MAFSAATGAKGIVADLIFAGRGTASDFEAIDASGKIALIERGDLTFKEKVENAAADDASAAIIYNNVAGSFSGTLQTLSAIPAVSLSREEGLSLKAELDADETVSVHLAVVISDYDAASGTSFSAPHVSGVAALVFAANPSLSNWQVRMILDLTAIDLGAAGYDRMFGFGLVDAEAAVAAAEP